MPWAKLVRSRGLEPPRLAALTPQASASTNSATTACSARSCSKPGRAKQAAAPFSAQLGFCQGSPRLIGGRALATLPAGGANARHRRDAAIGTGRSREDAMEPVFGPPIAWKVTRQPVAYEAACAVMAERVQRIAAGSAPELVWLLEHPPLYTAGTSAKDEDLLMPARLPVHRTGRGGQLTYHGPGQRVAYVMLDVKRRFGDVRAYVAALEGWIIDTLAALGVEGERQAGPRRGVGAPARAGCGGLRQDRRHRRAALALGELARHQHQRRARPQPLRGHRAVRHPRWRGHQPCRPRPPRDARCGRPPAALSLRAPLCADR